jgi:hypothetical protein
MDESGLGLAVVKKRPDNPESRRKKNGHDENSRNQELKKDCEE